ncbi:MAG: hypothetical protein ACYS67_11260 [Planctomycetota bacterium]|jgi:hypothetical protein
MACDSNQERKLNAELKINGGIIELNNFVENFISQAVIGMVTSLRGVGNIETIDLKISKKTRISQAQQKRDLCSEDKHSILK